MQLAELQQQLQAYLLGDGLTPAAPITLLGDATAASAKQRLHIYHYGYRARLHEVMASIYERLWAYLGDQQFAELVARYIELCPSRKKNLRDYGAGFSSFLTRFLPDDPEVAELAVMEWHLHNAFDTPNITPLSAESLNLLESEDWGAARFVFHPSVALAIFNWNSSDIWHALDQETPPPTAARLDQSLPYVFWRHGLRTHFRPLGAAEYLALSTQISGGAFSETCGVLAKHHPDSVHQIGQWLHYWIANEMIIGIDNRQRTRHGV